MKMKHATLKLNYWGCNLNYGHLKTHYDTSHLN
jgi:hypothetical protein